MFASTGVECELVGGRTGLMGVWCHHCHCHCHRCYRCRHTDMEDLDDIFDWECNAVMNVTVILGLGR
jgi:hypothetical protein